MTFDARHNERRIGRVAMGYGRDAVDVALTTTFGKHVLRKFQVWTEELAATPAARWPSRRAQCRSRRRYWSLPALKSIKSLKSPESLPLPRAASPQKTA